MDVPHKVYHFNWRVVGESLPTKKNLLKRCIVADGIYDLYEDEGRTVNTHYGSVIA